MLGSYWSGRSFLYCPNAIEFHNSVPALISSHLGWVAYCFILTHWVLVYLYYLLKLWQWKNNRVNTTVEIYKPTHLANIFSAVSPLKSFHLFFNVHICVCFKVSSPAEFRRPVNFFFSNFEPARKNEWIWKSFGNGAEVFFPPTRLEWIEATFDPSQVFSRYWRLVSLAQWQSRCLNQLEIVGSMPSTDLVDL